MVSGILHAGLLVMLMTSGLPSCGDGQMGTGEGHGEFVEVGIYVKQPADSPIQPEESKNEEVQQPESTNPNPTTAPATQTADSTASQLIELPDVSPRAVIGQSRGTPAPSGVPEAPDALVTSNAVRAPASQSLGNGPGVVSFMGQSTEAQSVVFVIDTSSSMRTNDAIDYAKAKLMQSINGLNQKQQFQIVSYTLVPTIMRLRNDRAETAPLYRATGTNLTLARQYINGLGASGGTKHRPALQEAFRFKPDVIFFLTDADEDRLSPREMSEIKTLWNKESKTHIHCFKFGIGPDLQPPEANFLRTLARENHGSYSYLDIAQLGSP